MKVIGEERLIQLTKVILNETLMLEDIKDAR